MHQRSGKAMASASFSEFTIYTRSERLADGVVHIVGVIASLVAISVLIVLSAQWRDPATITSVSVYGAGTLAVFCISAAYHLTPPTRAKAILRRFDHAAIFLKIAGTFTPFAVISIGGGVGSSLLAVVWSIAIIGIALKLAGWRGGEKLSVALYLAQGWLIVLAIGPMRAALETSELVLCMLGGGLYTLGCTFYLAKRMPFSNAIWHVFVLTASACFYAAILKAVVLR
jgi:hemolysin III